MATSSRAAAAYVDLMSCRALGCCFGDSTPTRHHTPSVLTLVLQSTVHSCYSQTTLDSPT